MKKLIVLNYNNGHVDIYNLEDTNFGIEEIVQAKGYRMDEVEWMVVDELVINYK